MSSDTYQFYVNEKIGVKYPNKEEQITDYNWTYTVVRQGNETGISSIDDLD